MTWIFSGPSGGQLGRPISPLSGRPGDRRFRKGASSDHTARLSHPRESTSGTVGRLAFIGVALMHGKRKPWPAPGCSPSLPKRERAVAPQRNVVLVAAQALAGRVALMRRAIEEHVERDASAEKGEQ